MNHPPAPATAIALEEALSSPTDYVVTAISQLKGDILILGAGGKMGPSLSVMAKRASEKAGVNRRVMAASRFSSSEARDYLTQKGVQTFACDFMKPGALNELPDAANIVYMAGMKFGATQQLGRTWAMNAWLPGAVCSRFPSSRIAVFSTGNIYGLVPVSSGGSKEEDPPKPQGEYAMSTLGRERIFEHFSIEQKMPQSIIRLNYACDLRYGVLVDIACKVLEEKPDSREMGYRNTIWQGDANAQALASLAHTATPPLVINVTGSRMLRVRNIAERLGELFGKPPVFEGTEATDALLSNNACAAALFGPPQVDEDQLIHWVADWLLQGGTILNKPTHFESRDGRF